MRKLLTSIFEKITDKLRENSPPVAVLEEDKSGGISQPKAKKGSKKRKQKDGAFMARQHVQAKLPHKNPGNVQARSRKNGNLTLTLRPGWDRKKDKSIGYPYGTLPRLLLFWLITE